MRTLAIGDIHGCLQALDALLAMVEPAPDDWIVTLGDYVDRGPDSRGVLDRMLALRQSHRLVAIRGNHDQMMLDARQGGWSEAVWLGFGGRATLASYAHDGGEASLADVPAEHWEFLGAYCVDWHETERHFFVHGNVEPNLPLAQQPRATLHGTKFGTPPPHISGKTMVCGHSHQRSGLPANRGHAVCVDTWVYGDGWLTCLDVDSGAIWQANQRGERRTLRLEDC